MVIFSLLDAEVETSHLYLIGEILAFPYARAAFSLLLDMSSSTPKTSTALEYIRAYPEVNGSRRQEVLALLEEQGKFHQAIADGLIGRAELPKKPKGGNPGGLGKKLPVPVNFALTDAEINAQLAG